MPRTVDIQPHAATNIRVTLRWLTQNLSPAFAARWHASINAAIQSLAKDPNRYPEADEAADLGIDLREMLHGHRRHVYRILFTIDGNTVNIHAVRHAAQDRLQSGNI